MTFSRTYQWLQEQIADELGDRQDLLSPLSDQGTLTLGPIQIAIQSAIALWEREVFYFNELKIDYNDYAAQGNYPWLTSAGQEYYGDTTTPNALTNPNLSSIAAIKAMWVLVAGQRYSVQERTMQELVDISISPTSQSSYPAYFCYVQNQIRFYPIPAGNFPILFFGTQKLSPLVNANDSNPWTQDAFDLVRCTAKLILAEEVLQDQDLAAASTKAIYGDPMVLERKGYLKALQGESGRRRGRGRVRPTPF